MAFSGRWAMSPASALQRRGRAIAADLELGHVGRSDTDTAADRSYSALARPALPGGVISVGANRAFPDIGFMEDSSWGHRRRGHEIVGHGDGR